jgi:hypothetical protein
VFRRDALQNVFLAVKAAQGVPTEDIHPKDFAYLVPELFDTNRRLNETTYNREKSSQAYH